jgi:hypothetical protein
VTRPRCCSTTTDIYDAFYDEAQSLLRPPSGGAGALSGSAARFRIHCMAAPRHDVYPHSALRSTDKTFDNDRVLVSLVLLE